MDPGTPITCKQCGAKLTFPAGATHTTCDYCQATVYAGGASPHAQRPAPSGGKSVGWKFGLGLLLVIVTVAVLGKTLSKKPKTEAVAAVHETQAPPPEPADAAPAGPPPVAKVVMTFGEKGTGAGQLTIARALAIMPTTQEIVIAEVATGRVQVFDAKGTYERVINVPPSALTKELSMYGVAADDQGHAVVSRSGDLVVIDVAAGKVAKIISGSYPERYYTADVQITPDNTIWAVTDDRGDMAVVHVSAAGKVLGTIKKTERRFAIDGVGNLYITKEFDHAVEIRDAKGEVTRKFSQAGPTHPELSHPDEIAIDGKGHVFVGDSNRVVIFDSEGAFLGELETDGINDLAVDRQGALYVLDQAKVTKYELSLPHP